MMASFIRTHRCYSATGVTAVGDSFLLPSVSSCTTKQSGFDEKLRRPGAADIGRPRLDTARVNCAKGGGGIDGCTGDALHGRLPGVHGRLHRLPGVLGRVAALHGRLLPGVDASHGL